MRYRASTGWKVRLQAIERWAATPQRRCIRVAGPDFDIPELRLDAHGGSRGLTGARGGSAGLSNARYDRDKFACVCLGDHELDANGNCVTVGDSTADSCTADEHYNDALEQCVCNQGLIRTDDGVCREDDSLPQCDGGHEHVDFTKNPPECVSEDCLRRELAPFETAAGLSGEAFARCIAQTLHARHQTLLLLVDQAEEFLTLCSPPQRVGASKLISALVGLDDPSVRVVVSIRGDFFHRLGELPDLGQQADAKVILLGTLDVCADTPSRSSPTCWTLQHALPLAFQALR